MTFNFTFEIIRGILIPLAGTSLGAACVFLMIKRLGKKLERSLYGLAAGVMAAASIWSLIIPAMDASSAMGKLSFLPATVGFWLGVIFLLIIDRTVFELHRKTGNANSTSMLLLAVTIHNIPEGMAVGAVFAGLAAGGAHISAAEALALAIGIAVQNFPEGAIISMPLSAAGMTRRRAFGYGVLSGIVEPVAACATILLADILVPIIPYLLGFAAGAMIYAVVEELIPEMSDGETSKFGMIFFTVGFTLMMILDVTLG